MQLVETKNKEQTNFAGINVFLRIDFEEALIYQYK